MQMSYLVFQRQILYKYNVSVIFNLSQLKSLIQSIIDVSDIKSNKVIGNTKSVSQ